MGRCEAGRRQFTRRMASLLFPQHIIAKKRDGGVLTRDEIASFVRGATDGSWADYQLSAMLMAIFLRGMSTEETATLTDAMKNSGVVADLSNVRRPKADKHSTGGVGDKVSLHLAPMVAACGVAVPMISGRGLGHSGGTLDKLESIPGFRVNLTLPEYAAQVDQLGLALIGQTGQLAPADKKLYSLRDVTATVESIPLICASILSKKLAEGTDVLVMDVKFGRGAFMKDKARARELAQTLVSVATAMGAPTRAVLTAMEEPLGRAVGNALEVAESIECLRGRGPADTMEVTYVLGEEMLLLTKVEKTREAARARLETVIANGAALTKFRELVAAQGGDARVIDDPSKLPQAKLQVSLPASRGGFVQDVDAMTVALAALRLGAGRARAEDKIDAAVGISGLVKVGEKIAAGAPLAVFHANSEATLEEARKMLAGGIMIGETPRAPIKLIDEIIG
ncbi:MAG: pyrimidine-nucleoside phosphorylase [Verrucomicrobia bacterium]|nr:pyrimidine-nucleoside phosphorylase [Verrucomicrobiota bacterium]